MSSRFTVAAKENLMAEIHAILQRPREFFKCPFTTKEWLLLYETYVPPEEVAAAKLLSAAGYTLSSATVRGADFLFSDNFLVVKVRGNAASFLTKNADEYPIVKLRKVDFALRSWADEVFTASDNVDFVLQKVRPVVSMANTIGQFARMAPELVPFLSTDTQARIAEQGHGSAFPRQWAAYPKDSFHEALTYLSQCALMPPVEFRAHANGLGFQPRETQPVR